MGQHSCYSKVVFRAKIESACRDIDAKGLFKTKVEVRLVQQSERPNRFAKLALKLESIRADAKSSAWVKTHQELLPESIVNFSNFLRNSSSVPV
jgi:hypothetical protein